MTAKEKMEQWGREGRIHFPRSKSGRLRRKSFADELKGKPIQSIWDDSQQIDSHSGERTGNPTQKPLALLGQIIQASSNDGDMVLDPYCDCANTCIAAEKLDRQRAGIDISPKAAEVVRVRMERKTSLFDQFHLIVRNDIPQSTDVGKRPPYKTHRYTLGCSVPTIRTVKSRILVQAGA